MLGKKYSKDEINWNTIAYSDTRDLERAVEVVIVDSAKGVQDKIGKIDFEGNRVLFKQYKNIVDKGCSSVNEREFVATQRVSFGGVESYDREEFESGVRECFELMIEEHCGSFWRQDLDYDDVDRIIEQFVDSMRLICEGEIAEDARMLDGDAL